MTNGTYRKPQADVYTLMLVLALLAIIAATVFMYLETRDYGSPPYQGGASVSTGRSAPALVLDALRPGAMDPVGFGGGSVLA
jgi:hypothetical protein